MEIVIFTVDGKEYGADISQIRQVIRMREYVPVPNTALFVVGVISLHGKIIPLISLRKKLGIEDERKGWNRILVTQLEDSLMGVIVDQVVDVVSIERGDITPPDDILKSAKYLIGVTKMGKRLILIVDIEKILSVEEMTGVRAVSGKVSVKKRDR